MPFGTFVITNTILRNRAVQMCRGWLDADEANGEFS